MIGYILKTHLAENPNREFFYQGTVIDPTISHALNTIVALDVRQAKVFKSLKVSMRLCAHLNSDPQLIEHGYTEFVVEVIKFSK